jgi:hypothetical protein
MKMLFTSSHSPEVGLLKSRLDEAGIPCELRNENTSSNFPGSAFQAELWILNDADYQRAAEIRDIGSSLESRGAWICPACGEESEGQFGSCWKCGANRDGAVT